MRIVLANDGVRLRRPGTLYVRSGLAELAFSQRGELSGGMAKRVGIARAMVMAPEILVYDEPTCGLDPTRREQSTA